MNVKSHYRNNGSDNFTDNNPTSVSISDQATGKSYQLEFKLNFDQDSYFQNNVFCLFKLELIDFCFVGSD